MPLAAVTAGQILVQVKAGTRPITVIRAGIYYVSGTPLSETLEVAVQRMTAAATVTSTTPLKMNEDAPTSLAVGGTSGTGYDGTTAGTVGDVLVPDSFNLAAASWNELPVPEGRIYVPASGIIALALITAPSESISLGGYIHFAE